MNKLIIAVFLIAITIASAFAINLTYATETTPTVTVDSTTQQFPSAKVGETIQVNIVVSNVQDLWAWSLTNVTFNPAILSVTQVTEGPFLQKEGQTEFLWTSNSPFLNKGMIPEIDDILIEEASTSGSGVLATISFQVVSLGTSQISFGQVIMYNSTAIANPDGTPAINVNVINSTITVGGSSNPTTAPSSNPGATASPTTQSSTSPTQSTATSPTTSASSKDGTSAAPEFPITLILAILIIAVTASTLLIAKNAKHRKK
jgi:hypothetical protein